MKRFLLWTMGIVLAAVAVLAVMLGRMDTDFVIRQIADATAGATGKPLVFESSPKISFFPPGVSFGQARWGQAEQDDSLAVSVKGGMAELEFMPLLSGNVVLREVRLDNPTVTVRQNAQVIKNGKQPTDAAAAEKNAAADNGSARENTSPAKSVKPDAAPRDAAPPVELKRLVIRQGSLNITDTQGQDIKIRDLNISAENLRPEQETTARCDFTIALGDAPGTPGHISGNLALSAKLRYAPPMLTLRQASLTFNPLSGPLPREAGPLQLNIEGSLDLNSMRMRVDKGWLATPQARLGIQGEAAFSPPAFTGNAEIDGSPRKLAAMAGLNLKPVAQGVTDGLNLKARLAYGNNSLNLSDIHARVDDITLRGQFRLGLEPGAPLSITADVQVGAINLDNYLPLPAAPAKNSKTDAAPANASTVASKKEKGEAGKTPMPDINIRLTLVGLNKDKLQFRDIQLAAQGLRGNYTITALSAILGSGGKVRATGAARLADTASPAYAVKGTASDVNLGNLLESLGKGRPLSGTALLEADLTMAGKDVTALQNSLSGKGLLEIRRMRLESVPTLPQNIPGLQGRVPDTFELVRAPFTARSGEIDVNPFSASAQGLNARGRAAINLPRQHLDATVNVETLGMTIPLIIRGPFDNISYSADPRFALDAASKLPAILQGKTSKSGTDPQRQDDMRGAGDLIRGLFGR
nr:AsmA family protein [uncultured Desulfovibrio sp.]